MTSPVYDLYFGRKNCVPSDFIFRGVFDNENEVVEALELIKTEKHPPPNTHLLLIDHNHQDYSLVLLSLQSKKPANFSHQWERREIYRPDNIYSSGGVKQLQTF